MNETDVRAEVLEPLLKRLGYRLTGKALIRREHALKYPATYLGRKKPGKDLQLRGVSDFTLEVASHARWTLEAKPPSVQLDDEVVQQAWSYAIHPEVQSSYFAICNGRSFKLYSTSAAWGSDPLLGLSYTELDTRFAEVAAFLAPDAIARRHPNLLLSAGKPLAPGRGSFVRVASGSISYHSSSIDVPLLSQMQVSILDGTISRDNTGRIQAVLRTSGPFRELQAEIERLGLSVQSYETDDEYLSLVPGKPTVFVFESDRPMPAGLDPVTFKPVQLVNPPRVVVRAQAIGHLSGETFGGEFRNEMTYHTPDKIVHVLGEGNFHLRLA